MKRVIVTESWTKLPLVLLGLVLVCSLSACAGGTRGTGLPDSFFPLGPTKPNGFNDSLDRQDADQGSTINASWPVARMTADCSLMLGLQRLAFQVVGPHTQVVESNPQSCKLALRETPKNDAYVQVQRRQRGVPVRFELYEVDSAGNRRIALDTTKLGYHFVLPLRTNQRQRDEQQFEAAGWELEISEDIPQGKRVQLSIQRRDLG